MMTRLLRVLIVVLAVVSGGVVPAFPAAKPLSGSRRALAYWRYFEALDAAADGHTDDARRKLEQVLEIDPDAADVYTAIARLCLRDGDILCAENRGARAVALTPDGADAHKILAEVDLQRFQRGHDNAALETALAHLAAAADAVPTDAATWVTWVRTLAANGRVPEAEAIAARGASIPGVDPAAPWMALARVFLGRGDPDQAIAILEKVEVPGKGGGAILETLADLKGSRGDLAGQAAALAKLREIRPEDGELAHRLGAVRLELGDFYGALDPLRDAYAMGDGDPIVRRDLARVLVRLGKGAEALDLLAGLPKVYRAPHTLLLWAQAAEQAGRFSESADRLDDLLAALGEDDRKSFGSALRLRSARDRLRAGEIDRALALTSGDADPSIARVRLQALDAANRSGEADAALATARAQRPGDRTLVALAIERTARRNGPSAGAEEAFAALRAVPDRARAAAEIATWLTAWDEPQLAATIIDAAGLADPPDPVVLRARASTLYAAGRLGEAEAAFRRLLDLDPNDDGALNDLGYLLAVQGRSLEEAVKMLERAVKLRPEQPAYLDSLGWALHRTGRNADALPLLQKAAQKARERDEPGIREHLGDVWLALGDPERARAEWGAALALGSADRERLQKKLGELPHAPDDR